MGDFVYLPLVSSLLQKAWGRLIRSWVGPVGTTPTFQYSQPRHKVRLHLAVQFQVYFYHQNWRKSNKVKNIMFILINFTSELPAFSPLWHVFDYGLQYMLRLCVQIASSLHVLLWEVFLQELLFAPSSHQKPVFITWFVKLQTNKSQGPFKNKKKVSRTKFKWKNRNSLFNFSYTQFTDVIATSFRI